MVAGNVPAESVLSSSVSSEYVKCYTGSLVIISPRQGLFMIIDHWPAKPMQKPTTSIKDIILRHKTLLSLLVFLAVSSNLLNLVFPKLIADAIDAYTSNTLDITKVSIYFVGVSVIILVLMLLQNIAQSFLSEKSARELRAEIIEKISKQTYAYTQEKTPAYLLTNLTSDVNAVKDFLGAAMPSLISSAFALVGASVLILMTDWKLGLIVLSIIPIMGAVMVYTFSKMGSLFQKTQAVVDKLNTVINNSIIGAALVRVLDSGSFEKKNFQEVNTESRENGLKILALFSSFIPIIMFASSLASIAILYFGGRFVITGGMSFGQFAAFNSYISILLFPIFIIGFSSSVIGRAQASMERIKSVLLDEVRSSIGTDTRALTGQIDLKNVSLTIGEKHILKNISFSVKPGSKTAIIGPTAGGKTQLLYCLSGLVSPSNGSILYDGQLISVYDADSFYRQVGIVFQDSILFSGSIRENVAFGENAQTGANTGQDAFTDKAIRVAELGDFVEGLKKGLDTEVSERGLSLSGGQKQRIILARALAQNPKILLLDDFTARVDAVTEKRILENIAREYPELVLISVTQKVSSVEKYDQIVVLVEGEIVGAGTHEDLLTTTPEYVQIYESQQSTTHYELQP